MYKHPPTEEALEAFTKLSEVVVDKKKSKRDKKKKKPSSLKEESVVVAKKKVKKVAKGLPTLVEDEEARCFSS
jgi:hypothetical protein